MPSANAVWKSALARGRGPASRRPKTRKITNNNQASQRLGGDTNGVSSAVIANSTSSGRAVRGGDVL